MATISLTSSSSSPPSPPTITPVSSPPAPPTISSISSHRELLGPNPFVDNFPNDYSPPPPPTTPPGNNGRFSAKVIIHIAFVVPVVIGIIVLGVVAVVCFRRIRNSKKQNIKLQTTVKREPEPVELFIGAHLFSPDARTGGISNEETGGISNEESLEYDFATIQLITNNFSPKNKIGEGGYGSVYKGKLPSGQEVAIKRLSKSSRQGEKEFKNEVEVVAKLQHKSLVKLLGYCSKGEEKILIYEYVSNGSLDYFLFDSEKRRELDWSKRYEIIKGIARGLLYLHQDSRLTIIHRDLKTSNILLDVNMIPKIADFGTAKIFGIDQTHGCTSQIVGTHGYMSPEYVMHGEFSMKSDVFSFGVMLLEIISGKKNLNTCQRTNNRAHHLLSYAWEQWRDGRPLQILDPVLAESSYVKNKVIHCLHIGLLCVQEDVDKRPTIEEVEFMLRSHSSNNWSAPCVPAFYQSGREAAERNIGNRTV